MKLLYCYIRFLDDAGNEIYYHGQKSIELNLSTKHRFTFYPGENRFERKGRKAPLPDYFWAGSNSTQEYQNIYNINVIAGQNGTGKTTIIRCVMELLDFLHAAANNDEDKKNKYPGVNNQFLLLFEDDSRYYLLSYIPTREEETRPIQMDGFTDKRPLQYNAADWSRELGTGKDILQSYLLKTKLIHITNTLSQYDYERNIKKTEQLRDYFIYDVSLGAAIGQDVNQFFSYDVYKQVKYVFDKNQLTIRKGIENQTKNKIIGFKVPDSLKLRLRMQRYHHCITEPLLNSSYSNLVELLGVFCVGAFAENLGIRLRLKEKELLPMPKQSIKELSNNTCAQTVLQQMILDVEQQYYDMELRREYMQEGQIWDVLPLPNGRAVICSGAGITEIRDEGIKEIRKKGTKNSGLFLCIALYNNKFMVAADQKGIIWRIDTDERHSRWKALAKTDDKIICITVSRDKRKIFCGSITGKIYILAVQPDLESAYSENIRVIEREPAEKEVTSIVATQNDSVFCTCKNGNIYGYIQEKVYKYSSDRFGKATCMTILPDDRMIIGSKNGCLYVWNPEAKKDTLRVWTEKHNTAVTCVTISSDGKRIISGSDKGEIFVWDSETEKCLYKMKVSDNSVILVAGFSDGKVGVVLNNGHFSIWNVPGGMILREKQKQLLKEIEEEEDDKNKSQSTILYENEIDKEMPGMGFAHILAENCLRYIKFIYNKKESFFKQINKVSDDIYEVSLDEKMPETFTKDMIQFMQKYTYTCEPAYTIDFDWGLSCGEENMLRIFSNLYHIFDRDYSSGKYGDYKIYNNENSRHKQRKKTECDTVLLFMDEADLTLHPEWQRCLIETLTTYIPQVYPTSCVRDIQLILTTHSPLLLGDIPGENITYLYCQKENEQEEENVNRDSCIPGETFGQNIHTILRDSFFLSEGTVGAFAAKKINDAAERMVEIKKEASNANAGISFLQKELKGIREIINIVAPGVLRIKLEDLLRQAENALEEKNKGKHNKAEKLLEDLRKLTPDDQQYVIDAIYQEKSKND